MLTLINILILFFISLLLYQILFELRVVEGLENQYQPYDTNDPSNVLILAQQNAGNISYIKDRLDRLDKLDDIYQQVQDLSGNVQDLQNQVNGIMQSQQDYANQMTGGSPPQITGAVDDSDTNNTSTSSSSNFITE